METGNSAKIFQVFTENNKYTKVKKKKIKEISIPIQKDGFKIGKKKKFNK